MIELNTKLAQLSDDDRADLYRKLSERLGTPSQQSVRELVLVYENMAGLDPEALREIARFRLPEQERPTRFIATDKLPRTPHGKLDRRGLPGLIRAQQLAPEDASAREEHTDEVLSSAIETFRHVLGTDSVGPDSNFFELGGHSLLAVECTLEFEDRIGERISITQFLNHPTPRGIARLLKVKSRESSDYVYPVSENMSGLPVFVFSASRLAYALKPHRPDWTIHGVQLRWCDENDEEIQYRNLEDMASRIAAEIRQLYGGGDFVLAGSSFPGMVAFEVARQLQASGNAPKLIILIEPSLWSGIRTWVEMDLDYYGRLKQGENHYLRWLAINNPFRAQFWRRVHRLSSSRRNAAVRAAEPMSTRAEFESQETSRTLALWRNYKASHYNGPAVLLAGVKGAWQMRRNWQPRLGRDCPVHTLHADHAGILQDPFMSEFVVPIVTSEVDALV